MLHEEEYEKHTSLPKGTRKSFSKSFVKLEYPKEKLMYKNMIINNIFEKFFILDAYLKYLKIF